jgi:surfactin synthase thioesterase subunit
VPFEYVALKYREKFHMTWQEFLAVPFHVFKSDMDMLKVENDVLEWRDKTQTHGVPTRH